ETERKLKELQAVAEKENLSVSTDVQSIDNKVKTAKKDELNRNKARIVREIEQEIVGRYYFQRGKVRKSLKNDPEVEEAVKLLNDPARYDKILSGR
ncbi:MAG: S41 family peptidase, partial [Saprospiraceae bacterium]|nr:S41 family peptidase [Saprospiraceae bacterium]